jgi:Protein of unknown function, DUF547
MKLHLQEFVISIFFLLSLNTAKASPKNTDRTPDTALLQLSEKFLFAVKLNESLSEIEQQLASLEYYRLQKGLNNDDAIKTFWLNMYNGWFQVLATREKLKNPEIFKNKQIVIASKKFSLDEIEHGILRKFRWKYSKGYLPTLFPGKTIRQLAVSKIDYRIHFALNCGAKSCPPIAFYSYNKINKQLDLATKSFLRSEVEIDTVGKTVSTTKIMDWFAGDFGGKKGTRKIIKNTLSRDISGYKIIYKPYNWDELLHNFSE